MFHHVDGEIGMAIILAVTLGIPMFVAMFPVVGWTWVVFTLLTVLVYFFPIIGSIIVLILIVWRMWMALPSADEVWGLNKNETLRSRILVVLGNGGSTSEMIYDMQSVEDWRDKFEAYYITNAADKKSHAAANTFEHELRGRDASVYSTSNADGYVALFFATIASVRAVFSVWPEVIVCNGPGAAMPTVLAAYIIRFFAWKRIAIVYTETLASVNELSPTGSSLYQMADVVIVQWDPLYRHCTLRFKYGHLLHGGRCRDGEKMKAHPVEDQSGDGTAIVTVGTQFDDLIRAVDSEDFVKSIAALGISKLKVQRGDGLYNPEALKNAAKDATMDVEVFAFSATLPEDLQAASLVVSHAGAGTVLDCLTHGRRMLIVPNDELTNNSEVKLCEELKKYGLVRWCHCGDIIKTLEGYTGAELKKFPEKPTQTFGSVLRQLCGRPNKEEKEERKRARADRDRYGYDRYN